MLAQILAITLINLRAIPARLGSSLVIVVGIGGVVGVLVWVGGINLMVVPQSVFGGIDGFTNPRLGGPQHLRVDGKITAEDDINFRIFSCERIDFGRQIVLHVTGGKQHSRQTDDSLRTTCLEFFKSGPDHRLGKFEKSAFDIVVRKLVLETDRELVEFINCCFVAAAVAAEHDGGLICHCVVLAFVR